MPVLYSDEPKPLRRLEINLHVVGNVYHVELLDLDRSVKEQRSGCTPEQLVAPRIFTTRLEVMEVTPTIVNVDGDAVTDVSRFADHPFEGKE